MARQIQGSQRDFSYGEIDLALKRADDHPARKAGLREMLNARILHSGAVRNRQGRRALFRSTSSAIRYEEIILSAGNTVRIGFGNHWIEVVDSAGNVLAGTGIQGGGAALPWTTDTVGDVVYAVLGMSIYITFPNMRPQVLTWSGSAWAMTDYTELLIGNQKRTPFYRISPRRISIQPSAQSGAITVSASETLFNAGWVGSRIRYIDRQILITGFIHSQLVNATVEEALPGAQIMAFASDPSVVFSIGDVVIGSISGSKGYVVALPGANSIRVQLLTTSTAAVISTSGSLPGTGSVTDTSTFAFVVAEYVSGPGGTLQTGTVDPVIAPSSMPIWDEEVMNGFRGYPASCFADQFRIGFCDFPAVPGAIAWSAINSPTDLYVGANPNNAIFEIAPDKVRVMYVVPGPESSEFVFCDHRLYYIRIDASNPLKPGSVGFQMLSGDGCAHVQPRLSQEAILYVNAGQNSVRAIIASGAYYRPFDVKDLTALHSHLFTSIVAIAVPTADGSFNERYVYVLNANHQLNVGKYTLKGIESDGPIGWGAWSSAGTVNWVSASAANVLFTTTYFGSTICEILDENHYLDGALPVNAAPAAFTPPGGKGPLWWIPNQTVTLIDQGTRFMGTYLIDANGFIIPQFNGGEDLTRADLVAGQPWTMIIEPYAPDAQSGVDLHQRMMRRRISNFAVYVVNSTGFTLQKLFSRKETTTSPPLGTPMSIKRVPAWNIDEDATLPPKQRETVVSWRPSGHSFDPRVSFIKDTPGPEQIVEFGLEVTL